jgi:hypothetical protein
MQNRPLYPFQETFIAEEEEEEITVTKITLTLNAAKA